MNTVYAKPLYCCNSSSASDSESVGKANREVAASSPRARRPHHELPAYEVVGPKLQRGARITHGRRRKTGNKPTADEECYWSCTSLSARGGCSSRDMQLVVGVAVHDTTLPIACFYCSDTWRFAARLAVAPLPACICCSPRMAARRGWLLANDGGREMEMQLAQVLAHRNFCLEARHSLPLTLLKLLTVVGSYCCSLLPTKVARDLHR
ncbi:hypothetical protein Dimus_011133 [Dionaea muscipula]